MPAQAKACQAARGLTLIVTADEISSCDDHAGEERL